MSADQTSSAFAPTEASHWTNGWPASVAPRPIRSSGPGVGRAGIVLSAELLNVKPKPRGPKTFRYS